MSLDRLPDSAVRNVDSEIRKAERSFCERLSEGAQTTGPFPSIAEADCVHVVSPEFLSD